MRRRGFTLIEVLVAAALVLGLSAALFAFIWGLLDRRERVLERCAGDAGAAAMLEELEGDLATTFVVDSRGGAGVVGQASGIAVRARGVAGGGKPSMSDDVGAEFRFEPGSGALTGTRGGVASPVGRLGRVQFRYWDGGEWRKEFDSAKAGRLPAMVEVRVWLDGAEGEDEEAWGRPDRERVIVVPDAGGAIAGVPS